jgi:hypothetical protein
MLKMLGLVGACLVAPAIAMAAPAAAAVNPAFPGDCSAQVAAVCNVSYMNPTNPTNPDSLMFPSFFGPPMNPASPMMNPLSPMSQVNPNQQ